MNLCSTPNWNLSSISVCGNITQAPCTSLSSKKLSSNDRLAVKYDFILIKVTRELLLRIKLNGREGLEVRGQCAKCKSTVCRVVKKTRQTPARTICVDSSRMFALHCNSPEHFNYLSVHLLYPHSSAVQVAQIGWSLSWLSDILYTKTEYSNSFVSNSLRLMSYSILKYLH